MRINTPRIPPLPFSEWDRSIKDKLGLIDEKGNELELSDLQKQVFNVQATLCNHPELMTNWNTFAMHIMGTSTLDPRDREILILRIGWLCQAEYEWAQHAVFGREVGLSEQELVQITEGPKASGWNEHDATLLRAVDELHDDAFVSEATWQALSAHYNTHQMMDIVFTVGQYNLVSMALNSFGVQLDAGLTGFPK